MDDQRTFVLQTCRERDIKFIRLWFTDILGSLKSFAITVEELEEALEEGMGFDGSSIEGFARIDESDMLALPDPTTFQPLPWRPRERGVSRTFCDIVRRVGAPPRTHTPADAPDRDGPAGHSARGTSWTAATAAAKAKNAATQARARPRPRARPLWGIRSSSLRSPDPILVPTTSA